jgi:release factor glutamine methyltransferase
MYNMTIEETVKVAAQSLAAHQIPDPYFEAECLLASVLKVDRLFLKKNPKFVVEHLVQEMMLNRVNARKEGSPLAYIIGKKAFWTFDLEVTPAVLIPRADTERLVEVVLEQLPEKLPYPVLELGTGSGAIALALAIERPQWQIVATDKSEAALAVAKKNAKRLQQHNIHFRQGDWFDAVKGEGLFSAVISNPPYIASSDPHLEQPALQAEPYGALCSGKTGLEAFITIVEQAKKYLANNGLICFEHGHDQSTALFSLLEKNGYHERQQFFDLSKIPRVITAEWFL